MRKKISRGIIKCFFTFFVAGLLIAPLRSGMFSIGPITGFCLSSIAGFIVVYFLTLYFLHKRDSLWIVAAAMAGFFIFVLPLHVFAFERTKISLLEMFIHMFAIAGAYLCHKLGKRTYQYLFSILILAGAYVVSTSGYDMWLHYLNYQTLSGEVKSEKLSSTIYFETANDSIGNTAFEKDLVLLDFWSSSCGYCYEAFPELQKLYDTYSKELEIFAVFVETRQRENYMMGDSILKARNYSFPVLFLKKEAPALSLLKVTGYPTVIILNRKGDVLFRGNIDNAAKYIKDTI